MTPRQNSIFSSMVICFTTSWSASISGRTMSLPRKLKVSSSLTGCARHRPARPRETPAPSPAKGRDGGSRARARCSGGAPSSSRNSRQKSMLHISGMFACAASRAVGVARRAQIERDVELDAALRDVRRVVGSPSASRACPCESPPRRPARHTWRRQHPRRARRQYADLSQPARRCHSSAGTDQPRPTHRARA